MYELLTRREAYLLFLAVGGDAAQLPEPLTPAEYFLYDECLRKAKRESEVAAVAGELAGEPANIIDPGSEDNGAGDNTGASTADPDADGAEVNAE